MQAEERRQFRWFFVQCHFSYFQLSQVEYLGDQLLQLPPVLAGHFQQPGLLGPQLVFLEQQTDGAEHQCKWSAQLVADIGKKAGLGRIEVFQLPGL